MQILKILKVKGKMGIFYPLEKVKILKYTGNQFEILHRAGYIQKYF